MILVTPYLEWIASEAALIDTDGCTGVTGAHVACCLEHDAAYFHGKDPHDAYRKALDPDIAPGEHWQHAEPITRAAADARFRRCLQARSALGAWSLLAWWRWAGVRLGGQGAWDAHRKREQKAEV